MDHASGNRNAMRISLITNINHMGLAARIKMA
jgi:hypothetical protein